MTTVEYVTLPRDIYERLVINADFLLSETPTVSQVAAHIGISTQKIMKDLRKQGCPLMKAHEGKSGRGNETQFFRASVNQYKQWLNK